MGQGDHTVIGAFNEDIRENRAFFSFTGQFRRKGLNVPEVYLRQNSDQAYLVEDLGDVSLYRLIREHPGPWEDNSEIPGLYRKVLRHLASFQLAGHRDFDYSACMAPQRFGRQSFLWDLHYFKYYCLKLFGIPFDEQALEEDFGRLAETLDAAGQEYFLYRDFQSRNIMLSGEEPWFIDYQGGRQGALHYDLATLLYQSRIGMPGKLREELLREYLSVIGESIRLDEKHFARQFRYFVLVRLLQVMAAFGLRGVVERKALFLSSIHSGIANLQELLSQGGFDTALPELTAVIGRLTDSPRVRELIPPRGNGLVVTIRSFSYKKGIPDDPAGNGGGFVFDCRALPNPGRVEGLVELTGLDPRVKDFMEGKKEVSAFLNHTGSLVIQAVNDYIQRKFSHLAIGFGCTGGQHRSVYCAEKTADLLRRKTGAAVIIKHRELT